MNPRQRYERASRGDVRNVRFADLQRVEALGLRGATRSAVLFERGERGVTTDYHIEVFYSAEDESWIANVPDLRFCSAHGETPEDAVREVMIAMEAWLDTARQHGDPIPPATYRPATPAAG